MKKIIARQPILDANNNTIAYELLFRSIGGGNKANVVDGNAATIEVLKGTLIDFGIDKISSHKRVFINFTEDLIKMDAIELLKKDRVVIELLEDIFDSEEIIEKVMEYKRAGYTFALDDFTIVEEKLELLKIIDIVKVDFIEFTKDQIIETVNSVKKYNKILLAEKVETREEFEWAKELGFTMFQGFYFLKPEILEEETITSVPTSYTKLLMELNKEKINFDLVAESIKQDTSLTYSFLNIVNSFAYYSRRKIDSVKDAFIRLGLKEGKRIIYINFLKTMAPNDTPGELIKKSLIRGKMAESLASNFNIYDKREKLFLLGMFSLMSIILKKDMASILTSVPLATEIQDALLGKKNDLSNVMDLIVLNERNKMESVEKILNQYNIDIEEFGEIYFNTIEWSDNIFEA